MIEFIICLAMFTFVFWLGFHVAGALLSAAIWLFVKLPLAVFMACMGLIFCATILLIPLGGKCFSFAGSLLFG